MTITPSDDFQEWLATKKRIPLYIAKVLATDRDAIKIAALTGITMVKYS